MSKHYQKYHDAEYSKHGRLGIVPEPTITQKLKISPMTAFLPVSVGCDVLSFEGLTNDGIRASHRIGRRLLLHPSRGQSGLLCAQEKLQGPEGNEGSPVRDLYTGTDAGWYEPSGSLSGSDSGLDAFPEEDFSHLGITPKASTWWTLSKLEIVYFLGCVVVLLLIMAAICGVGR